LDNIYVLLLSVQCINNVKSWDKTKCTVTLCETVIVCCIVKTALISETFLKPNCSYVLMIMSYKT